MLARRKKPVGRKKPAVGQLPASCLVQCGHSSVQSTYVLDGPMKLSVCCSVEMTLTCVRYFRSMEYTDPQTDARSKSGIERRQQGQLPIQDFEKSRS